MCCDLQEQARWLCVGQWQANTVLVEQMHGNAGCCLSRGQQRLQIPLPSSRPTSMVGLFLPLCRQIHSLQLSAAFARPESINTLQILDRTLQYGSQQKQSSPLMDK